MGFTVSYKIKAEDHFSKTAQDISTKLNDIGNSAQKLGKSLSLKVTAPIAALGAVAVKSFADSERGMTRMRSIFNATGGAVGIELDRLTDIAEDFQKRTTFAAGDIIDNVTSTMLSYTTITGDIFEQAQQAAVDYAAGSKKDLGTAAKTIARALDSPKTALSLLERDIGKFTDTEKELIEGLVDSGALIEAQAFLLHKLAVAYEGSGEALANSTLGPMLQLKNEIGALNEEIGGIILTAINPFIEKLKSLIIAFQGLDAETKETIVKVAGIAASVGPLLIGLGLLIKTLALAASGFAIFLSPVGLIIAGLTALGIAAYALKDKFEPVQIMFDKIGDSIKFIVNNIGKIKDLPGAIGGGVSSAFGSVKDFLGFGGESVAAQEGVVNRSTSIVDININDKAGLVGNMSAKNEGVTEFNLGKNMALGAF